MYVFVKETFEYRYALIPEEFLIERLPAQQGNSGGNSSGNVTPSSFSANRHYSSSASATPSLDGKTFKFFTPSSITMEPSKSKKNKFKNKDGKGKHSKRHSHDGASGFEHMSSPVYTSGGGLAETNDESQRRMMQLEKQIQRLSDVLSQVANVGTLAILNGAVSVDPPARRGRKPGRKPGSTNKNFVVTPSPRGRKPKSVTASSSGKVRARAEKRRNLSSDEDSDDESVGVVMDPFDPKSVTDLRKLKTDLENLKGMLFVFFLILLSYISCFSAKDLQNVLRILQSCEASVTTDADSNVEIDFEKLKPKTLVDLRNYVNSVMRNQESPSAIHASTSAAAAASSSFAGPSGSNKRMRGSTDCDNSTVPTWSRTDSRTSNVRLSEESSSEDSEMDE